MRRRQGVNARQILIGLAGTSTLALGASTKWVTYLLRWNYDGPLAPMGWKDSQTKIRGQRIELEGIEHHIA